MDSFTGKLSRLLWQLPGQVHLGLVALGHVHLGGEAATMAATTAAVGEPVDGPNPFGASEDGIVGGGMLIAGEIDMELEGIEVRSLGMACDGANFGIGVATGTGFLL